MTEVAVAELMAQLKIAEGKIEAERVARIEAERRAEAKRVARIEAERKAEEADQQAKEKIEAERVARIEAERRAEEEKKLREYADGSSILRLGHLSMEKQIYFLKTGDIPPARHKRPGLFQDLLDKIPEKCFSHVPKYRESHATEALASDEDLFGNKVMEVNDGMTTKHSFPNAHILAQGVTCRALLLDSLSYIISVDARGESPSQDVLEKLSFGFRLQEQGNATVQHNFYRQSFNLVKFYGQYEIWDQRHALLFLVDSPWVEQMQCDPCTRFGAFVFAERISDYQRIGVLTGSRVTRMDLKEDETRVRLCVAIEAAAEGLNDILSRVLAKHSADSEGAAGGIVSEPFRSENKLYTATLSALKKQGFMYVFDSEKLPDSGQVLYVEFPENFPPHPALLTVKGINVFTNRNFQLDKISGLTCVPGKTAISIPGCLAVEGPQTSCGLCRFHFSTQELGCRPSDKIRDGLALAPEDAIREPSVVPVVSGTCDGEPSSPRAVSSPDVSAGRMMDVRLERQPQALCCESAHPTLSASPDSNVQVWS
jgi:hypothetical protein